MKPLVVLLLLAMASGGRTASPTPVSGRYSIAALRQLAASLGFADPNTAAAIAMAESGGNPQATNIVTSPAPGNLPERSFGLWQINTLGNPQFNEAQLLDPTYNARAALSLSRGGTDFRAWSTFNSGLYKRYMP